MMRIAALNDSSSEFSNEEDIGPSQEALEADATRVYRKAISHLTKNEIKEAKESLFEVLNNPYIARAEWHEEFDRSKVLPQDIALKYSCYKNLGNLYMTEKLYSEASNFYIKAIHLDSTEVTLWQKLGASSIKIKDFELAVVAFQEGLLINPNHWPCIDQLLSVSFLLGFYEDCLSLAIQTLKRDSAYIKALAFKDYIFEQQPSFIVFAKEFFTEAELLFVDVTYDKAKGDKFINTCLELRPRRKEPRAPSPPIPPRKVAKSLNKFQWVELADALIHTYDELQDEEPRAIVGKLELEPVIKDYVDFKLKIAIKENLKNDLTNVFKPGRRLSRSLSYNDDLLSNRNKNFGNGASEAEALESGLGGSLPVKGSGDAAPKRRQTIELGEGQESFRVGSRRSSADSEPVQEMEVEGMVGTVVKSELTKMKGSEEVENGELIKREDTEGRKEEHEGKKVEAVEMRQDNNKDITEGFKERSNEDMRTLKEQTESEVRGKSTKEIEKGVETLTCDKGGENAESEKKAKNAGLEEKAENVDCKKKADLECDKKAENVECEKKAENAECEKKAENTGSEKKAENADCEKKAQSVGENLPGLKGVEEAAVNQLKDIMALKPPTGILNLSQSQFEYDQDYCEYFDGGVYEEDEEDDEDEEDEEEEMETEDNNTQSDEVKDDNNKKSPDPKESDDEDIEILLEKTVQRPATKPGPKNAALTVKKPDTKPPQNTGLDPTEPDDMCVVVLSSEEVDPIAIEAPEPAPVVPPVAPKKPKRQKRGLERELEQLDYWGRRKAREAKRRRRTLTSRLVGLFDDSEYLTWAYLIRSFIPAALLSVDESDTSKEGENRTNEASNTNPRETPPVLHVTTKDKQTDDTPDASADPNASKCEPKGEPTAAPVEKDQLSSYKFLEEHQTLFDASQWTLEELEVGEFLESMKENGGVLEVMQRCLRMMIKKYGRSWPLKCANAYTELYFRIREHITVGATLSSKEDPERLLQFADAALTQLELLLNLSTFSDRATPGGLKDLLLDPELHLSDDIFHLSLLLSRPEVWKESEAYLQAHLRVAFVQARVKGVLGSQEEAAAYLQILIEQMRLSTREGERPLEIRRCRIEEDSSNVTLEDLKNQLNVLQRSQMLGKVEWEFEAGHYQEVVQILTSIFHDYKTKVDSDTHFPPRHTQLSLLVESLVKLEDVKGVIQWGSLCLNESVKNFQSNVTEDEDKKMWNDIIQSFLLDILDVISAKADEVCNCDRQHLVQMILCIVNILVLQLEQGSGLPQPYFNTLSPWMILHIILSQYEKSRATKMIQESTEGLRSGALATIPEEQDTANEDSNDKEGSSKDKVGAPAPSTLLLITAHEELGKNSWCGFEDGTLLLYILDALTAELENPLAEEQRTILHQAVEQIMFCLFSHPSRKTRYKHLRDHAGQSIPLTWKSSIQLFKYYLPQQLPEFQSSQIASITDDVAVLFRRILSLMPDHFKHPDQIKDINAYIEGEIPDSALTPLIFPPEIKDCYYLLADNYFKGKEWDQAVQYYKLDVSVNCNRIDSWAPMGLAKKAQLETLLNSCEVIKNDEEFFKEAHRAKRCLDRGLLLDLYFSNLWVEKGGLVYMIHSHASRLLNQDLNPDMSIEMFESLEKIKSEMLIEASKCFCEASKIVEEGWEDYDLTDERWLYQYMLGKLAEKMGKPPSEVLNHYLDAFQRLDDIGAKYPEKINYNNVSDYAVEALEVYFRINVYIFKFLNQREGKDIEPQILRFLKSVMKRLAKCPFVLCKEKHQEESELTKNTHERETSVMGEINTKKRPCVDEEEDGGASSKKQKSDGKDSNEASVKESVDEALDTSLNKEKESGETGEEIKCKEKTDKLDSSLEQKHLNEEREEMVLECLNAFNLCVARFSHHYKSLYRIAYFYHHSQSHKENAKARQLLLGCNEWQSLNYMPSNGLFNERKISLQNPKNSNLFHGVWRIPHDEIDRPGSFAAHMYRCVSLCLDILQETKDFYTVLEIAYSLRGSPDKDKKYLRDNERELLSEHATQAGVQTMKDKFRFLFKSTSSSPPSKSKQHAFLIDVYKAYKQMSKHLPISESSFSKVLIDSYVAYSGAFREGSSNILRDAENFCIRNPSSLHSSSVNSGACYQSVLKMGSAMPSTGPVVIKRGRPPAGSRDFGALRFMAPHDSNPTVGQTVAVQQAYKVYENLIQAQTILNKKNLDGKSLQFYQGKYEEYKQQMLKYLQIQSVSQFFHSSLQSIGTSTAKLPPPPPTSQMDKPTPSVIISDKIEKPPTTTVGSTSLPQGNQSLSSLAARSKAHGISISAVSKKPELSVTKSVKPAMSITVSQTKPTTMTVSANSSNTVSIVNLSKERDSSIPREVNTTKPKEAITTKPKESNATKPKEITVITPKEVNATKPKEVTITLPKDVIITKFKEVAAVKPTEFTTIKPTEITVKPKEVTTAKPKEITTAKPKEITTVKLKEVTTVKPKEVITVKPKDVVTVKPKEVVTVKPKEVVTVKPKEVITAKPTEVITVKPKEVITVKPKDVITISPKEVITVKLKDVINVKPKEVITVKPKDVTTVKPKEVINVKPREVITVKPKEITTVKPKEVTDIKPKEMITVKPKEVTNVKPNEVITVKPKELTTVKPKELTTVKPREIPTTNLKEVVCSTKPKEVTTVVPKELNTTQPKEATTTAPKDVMTTQSPPVETSLPKLPPGTTLSRQTEGSPAVRPKKSVEEPTIKKSRLDALSSSISTKGSVTITQAPKQSSASAKKKAVASFQDAFQASLAKAKLSSNNVTIISPGKEVPPAPALALQPKKGIKVSSLKFLNQGDNKMWENLASSISGKVTSTSVTSTKTSTSIANIKPSYASITSINPSSTSTKPSATIITPTKPSSTSITSTTSTKSSTTSTKPSFASITSIKHSSTSITPTKPTSTTSITSTNSPPTSVTSAKPGPSSTKSNSRDSSEQAPKPKAKPPNQTSDPLRKKSDSDDDIITLD